MKKNSNLLMMALLTVGMGLSVADIAKATELSAEEIEKLNN